MTSADNLPPVKSCVHLDCLKYIIPLDVLKAPFNEVCRIKDVEIGFLTDRFIIFVVKTIDNYVRVTVCRYRENSNKKHDDGYALRFYITVTGFDEKPQVSVMKHDDDNAKPVSVFKLSENIIAKMNTSHYAFDLFVVAQMLEFKNIGDEENVDKMELDLYLSTYLRPQMTEKEHRNLCFILKCSALEDIFTGRLPSNHTDVMIGYIQMMSKNNARLAKYLKARFDGKCTENHDADLNNVLEYASLTDEFGPKALIDATMKYKAAHMTGLDCMKVIIRDYLLRLLDKNSDSVLFILDVALTVHDEDLFNKAIFSLLNNFHEVTRSEIFEHLSEIRPAKTRLSIHSARVWITNNDVYIPGWKQSPQLTKKL